MTTRESAVDKWKAIPWKKLQKVVFRLQVRIYKARKNGNALLVRKLQKLLLSSRAAKMLAIRQVTQLNMGKRTKGVDNKSALTTAERLALYEHLSKNWKQWKHQPLQRVFIPKTDGTQRGLGIPTISDRAYQCLLKYALEPAAEAIFGARSFGFRPGRSCHDVQQKIFSNLNSNANGITKRILELDIEKCFDKIDHKFLMQSVQLPKAAKSGLFKAIKAGVRGEFPSSESGTPQGGVISPLLANLVLHGLEDLGIKYTKSGKEKRGQTRGFRYADDVVYILQPNEDAGALRVRIDDFLASRGLKVKEAKTKLVHSTDGFDFLGWHLKVKPNGKFISTPSQASYRKIKDRVKETMKDSRFPLKQRIAKCGLIVRGWRNYHQFCDMSSDNLWSSRYWTWKYIRKQGSYDCKQTNKVIETAFPTVKWSVNSHVNVKGEKSPFDGDTIYWSERSNKSYSGITVDLLKRQKHTCNQCGFKFFPDDIIELHHIDGNRLNRKSKNLEVLHRECHQHESVHGEVRARKAV